jgi:hypothetical protein
MLAFLEREAKQRLVESSDAASAANQARARREALQQMCRVIFNLNELRIRIEIKHKRFRRSRSRRRRF